ncbi:MAG TPA: hypothetical protein VMZ71_06040 [Gemmataceae bacterium]|nr:hypothetical protein [Gemmataceae bacterium]
MTPEERAREDAWLRRRLAHDDGEDITAGRVPVLAKKFPIPDTTGMTPEQAEATLAKWRAEVKAFTDAADRAHLASPAPPEVSAS